MNHADDRLVGSKHSFETSHDFVLISRDFDQLSTRELGDRWRGLQSMTTLRGTAFCVPE